MREQKLNNFFWRRFSRYLLIGLCGMALFAAMIQPKFFIPHPNLVAAEEDGSAIDPGDQSGEPLSAPNPEPQPPAEEPPPASAPPPAIDPGPQGDPAPPAAAPNPVIPEPNQGDPAPPAAEPFPAPPPAEENPVPGEAHNFVPPTLPSELPGERPLEGGAGEGAQDCTTNPNQPKCQQPGAPGRPVAAPTQGQPGFVCPRIDVIRVEEDCFQGSVCKFNVWQGPNADGSCKEGRGGAFGCRVPNPGECGVPFPGNASQPVTQNPSGPSSSANNVQCPAGQTAVTTNGAVVCINIVNNPTNTNTNTNTNNPVPAAAPARTVPAPVCNNINSQENFCSGQQFCTVNVTRDCRGSEISRSQQNCQFVSGQCNFSSGTNICNDFTRNVCVGDQECQIRTTFANSQCNSPSETNLGCQRIPGRCGFTQPVAPVPAGTITQTNTQRQDNPQTNTQTVSITIPRSTAPAGSGTAVMFASSVCPPGSNKTIINNEVVCQVFNPTAVKVAGFNVTELPKTGVPLAAWALGAFLPTGFGLKRFSKHKMEASITPQYMWEERQFKTHHDQTPSG